MKRRFLSLSILLVAALVTVFAKDVTAPADLPAYYQTLNGKSASGLFDAVHSVTLVGFSSLGYDGALGAYQTTDVYPADSVGKAGKLWDMYGACGFTSGDECGNYNNECDCYNREHSIPKSWWGSGKNDTYSDIFHLVPTDGYVNNRRSNYAFGEVDGTPTYTYKGAKLGSPKKLAAENTIAGNLSVEPGVSPVFEPIDQYKGDFARGYMGTLLHYTSLNMTSGHGGAIFSGSNTQGQNYGLTEYGVALLLKWHRMDPVSQKEIDRNNGIQETQGNRNPFIDYPDLAEYIWGSHAGEVFMLADATATFADDYEPATGGGGTIEPPVVEPYDLHLYRNGDIEDIIDLEDMYNLPTQEEDACDDWVFEGWSASKIEKTSSKPTYITWVNADATVYAVYKNVVVSEGGSTTTTILMEDYKAISGTFGDFTFAAEKNNGSSNPTYNSNNKDARLYAKGTLTISCENEMSEIIFNLSAQGLKRLAPITASVGTIETQASGDKTVTWTGSAKSVTFTVGDKSDYGTDSSAGQLCFTSVDITTGSGSKVTTYASDAECVAPCEGQLATPAVTATAGDKQITLTWADVENADHYEVAVSAGVGFTTECGNTTIGDVTNDGAKNTCVITGLVNGLEYTTTVRAIGTSVCDSEADTDTATPTDVVVPTVTLTFIIGGQPYELENVPVGAKMADIIAGLLADYPTTYQDERYVYTYDGFVETLPEFVTEDATFTVKYTTTDRLYTITFTYMDEFGVMQEDVVTGLKYGDEIKLINYWPNDGYRDETYSYYILGWRKNGEGERIELDAKYTVDGDAELIWDYEMVKWYTITFYDEDGTTVLQNIQGDEAFMPNYTNPTPEKDGRVFAGWAPALVPIAEGTSYVATYREAEAKSDALVGAFSVSADKKVRFAKGNIQYNIAEESWSLATEQYNIIGAPNINLGSADFTETIDMFGWSSDGKFGVNPSNANADYDGTFEDWGHLFGEEWYTLSWTEWNYLLKTRTDAAKKWANAMVVDRKGVVLLPDNWELPAGLEFEPQYKVEDNFGSDYEKNKYSVADWAKMEAAGAVFLPTAGRRTGGYGNMMSGDKEATFVNPGTGYYSWMDNIDVYGYYWTSTQLESGSVYYLFFGGADSYWNFQNIVQWSEKPRYGQSVRLAKEAIYSIEVIAGEHGQATGSGDYAYGETATLTAIPDEHYQFAGWSDGETEAVREIVVNKDLTLTAIFKLEQFTITASGENGTVEGAGIYDYGTEIQLIANGNKGYTFEAWEDGDMNNPRTITVTADATYTAIFAAVPYTITKNVEGQGSILGPDGGNLNDVAKLTAVPAEGWSFAHWENDDESAERELTITGNMEVTATFTINSYKLTYMVDGEVDGEIETIEYGKAITPREEPTKDGYTFSGWSEIPETMPDHNVVVTGTFAINKYTLTFIVGSVTFPIENVEYGTLMAVVLENAEPLMDAELEKYGVVKNDQGQYQYSDAQYRYTFTGWDKEMPETVTSDLTFIAQFSKESLTPTGVDAFEGGARAVKVYENGVVYILRNGKKYTVYGSLVE